MKDPGDQSIPTLNINSRPPRNRKKRNFSDFEVDLPETKSASSFLTSTPNPSPSKRARKGNSSCRQKKGRQISSLLHSTSSATADYGDDDITDSFNTSTSDVFGSSNNEKNDKTDSTQNLNQGDISTASVSQIATDEKMDGVDSAIKDYVETDKKSSDKVKGNRKSGPETPGPKREKGCAKGNMKKNASLSSSRNEVELKDDSSIGQDATTTTTAKTEGAVGNEDALKRNFVSGLQLSGVDKRNSRSTGVDDVDLGDTGPSGSNGSTMAKTVVSEGATGRGRRRQGKGSIRVFDSNDDDSDNIQSGGSISENDDSVAKSKRGKSRSRGRGRGRGRSKGRGRRRLSDTSKGRRSDSDDTEVDKSFVGDSSVVPVSGSGCVRGRGRGRSRGRGRGRVTKTDNNVDDDEDGIDVSIEESKDDSTSARKSGRTPSKRLFSSYTEKDEDEEEEEAGESDNDYKASYYERCSARRIRGGKTRGKERGGGGGRDRGGGEKRGGKGGGGEKRGKGRQRKELSSGIESSSMNDEEVDDKEEGGDSKAAAGGSNRKTPKKTQEVKCTHCEMVSSTKVAHKYHLMAKHSLVASKACPEGEENPRMIIKVLGSIQCPKCGKKTKNPQYYRHHLVWCGREEEKFDCPICHKLSPAMWEYQHMNTHSREDVEKKAREVERLKKLAEEGKKEGEEEKEEEEGKAKKRKAAKSALDLITSLDKGPNPFLAEGAESGGEGSQGDGNKQDDGDDDNDDDDVDVDDNDNDDDDDSDKNQSGFETKEERRLRRMRENRRERERERKKREQQIKEELAAVPEVASTASEFWRMAVGKQLQRPSHRHASMFYHEAKERAKVVLFEDRVPLASDWLVLKDRERERYLPPIASSQPFVSVKPNDRNVDEKVKEEAVSLQWGQASCVNGKTFCFTGGPIWAMEWCPLPVSCPHPQVLALTSDRQREPQPGMGRLVKGPGLVQFWTLVKQPKGASLAAGQPVSSLTFAIAHDCGYVRSVAWCPTGGFDQQKMEEGEGSEGRGSGDSADMEEEEVAATTTTTAAMGRLGLLAVACSDSSVLVYSIPQASCLLPPSPTPSSQSFASAPDHYDNHDDHDKHQDDPNLQLDSIPIYRPTPIRLVLNSTAGPASPCMSVAWQGGDNCRFILAGFGDGKIVMWDLASTSPLIRIDAHTTRPSRFFNRHEWPLVCVSWCPSVPTQFASTAFDGPILVWDIDHPKEPLAVLKKNVREPTRALCWACPLYQGIFSVMDKKTSGNLHYPDRIIQEGNHVSFHGLAMLCIDTPDFYTVVTQHPVCTWDVTFHPLYEILVTCDAAGNVQVMLPDMREMVKRRKSYLKAILYRKSLMILYKINPKPKKGRKRKKEIEASSKPDGDDDLVIPPPPLLPLPASSSSSLASQTSAGVGGGKKKKKKEEKDDDNNNDDNKHTPARDSQDKTALDSQSPSVPGGKKKKKTEKNEEDNPFSLDTAEVEEETVEGERDPTTILYRECSEDKTELQLLKTPRKMDFSEREVMTTSNVAAVHRVRLCPSLDKHIWLASGGQNGLLRLDDLAFWVKPHRRGVIEEIRNLNKSKPAATETETSKGV